MGGSLARFLEVMPLAEGCTRVHTPGIAGNRAGQGFARGERKSGPKDARTIAERVRTRDLRPIQPDDETLVALRLKVGRRRDLVQDQTRRLARLRGLLFGIHPGLERALDVTCEGPLARLARDVTPAEIRRAGKARIVAHLAPTPHLRAMEALADSALAAARAQRSAVTGEAATAGWSRELAVEALDARRKLAQTDRDLETLLSCHPDGPPSVRCRGWGRLLAAAFLACTGDIRRSPAAAAPASAAGLAPVLRQSGKRTGWRRVCGGDPLSRAFYERKRRKGKHHAQALIALARRRVTVLRHMLHRRKTFDPNRKAA